MTTARRQWLLTTTATLTKAWAFGRKRYLAKKADEIAKLTDSIVKKNIQITYNNIDRLEVTLTCADENGLFKNKSEAFHRIFGKMVAARHELDNENMTEEERDVRGWQKYRDASCDLNETFDTSASSLWRFSYLYGGPFIIYFLVILGSSVLAWLTLRGKMPAFEGVPLYAFLWGLIGGVLQGLWFLWGHVNDRKIRKAWIPWYLLLPVIGALLGALMYLAFVAGLVTTTGSATIQTSYFVILLCALAGFSSKWAVETLDKITQLVKVG